MINEIIAFVLGFITAFILFAIIGYRQKRKLEQLSKAFDISTIREMIEKSKIAEQINWEEEERKREIEMGKHLKKKIKVEENEK
jgi:uncharacterized membrane protein